MKTRIKFLGLLAIMLLSLASLSSFAQQKIEVKGLIINQKYTHQQIVDKLGTPTKISSFANDQGGTDAVYYYQSSTFGFCNNGVFESFNVVDSRFKILGGQVKVGDNISKLSLIPDCKFKLTSQYWPNDPNVSDLLVVDYDMPILVEHKNEIITTLIYSQPL